MKPSAYAIALQKIAQLEKEKADLVLDIAYAQKVQKQRDIDSFYVALYDMDISSDQANGIIDRFLEAENDISVMALNDVKDDKQINYTKGKIDQILEKIMGDKFVPWEERYICDE